MFIAVAQLLSNEPEVGNGITIQVLLRSVIFAVLVYVVVKMHRGNDRVFTGMTINSGLFGISRIVHLVSVITALILSIVRLLISSSMPFSIISGFRKAKSK
ncbi:hypothetical protein P4H67_12415 [Paenibacillus lautus]|uniref:hypothetical protein n=1 Tax=Paenibacillus lautus TaxID=1401 RepID=UPI002DB6A1C9|nr:hypothetical protein [Paenibacillus lautus]MEC0307551.1 hypothetical protein [Paenibacillus lautus]